MTTRQAGYGIQPNSALEDLNISLLSLNDPVQTRIQILTRRAAFKEEVHPAVPWQCGDCRACACGTRSLTGY